MIIVICSEKVLLMVLILFVILSPDVLSRNYFILENIESDFVYMKTLNQKKVQWIVREMDEGDRSVYRIAKTMKVTSQWAREEHRVFFVPDANLFSS